MDKPLKNSEKAIAQAYLLQKALKLAARQVTKAKKQKEVVLKEDKPLEGREALDFLKELRDEGMRQANEDKQWKAELWGGNIPTGGIRYTPLENGRVSRICKLKNLYGHGQPTEIIVSLMPSMEIEFRETFARQRYRLSLEVVLLMALKAEAEREKSIRHLSKGHEIKENIVQIERSRI